MFAEPHTNLGHSFKFCYGCSKVNHFSSCYHENAMTSNSSYPLHLAKGILSSCLEIIMFLFVVCYVQMVIACSSSVLVGLIVIQCAM